MKTKLLRIFPLLLIALAGGLIWHAHQERDTGRLERALDCPDLHQGCGITLDGKNLRISVVGELRPLHAFQVRVEAPGVRKAEARFSMEGMDMGFNLYSLRADNTGAFQARVTLPVCVSGRRDWIMHLDLDGARVAVPFVTDL